MEIQESSRKCSFVICIENNFFIVNNQSDIKKIQSIVYKIVYKILYIILYIKFNLSLPTFMVNCNLVYKELKIVIVSSMYSDGNARTMLSISVIK